MARTNATKQKPQAVTNRAGGHAYALSDALSLTLLVLTSFNEDQFYRSADQTRAELRDLVAKCGGDFCIRLAVYARRAAHMRSISQILIAETAHIHPGTMFLRKAVVEVCERADDMAGIVAYSMDHIQKDKNKKKLPAALYHGLRLAFNKFNNFELGKYSLTNSEWKMIDVVRMVRPTPQIRNKKALAALVKDGKYSVDTWESVITAAGSDEKKKKSAWNKLVKQDKLGYMAALRNLRNIAQYCNLGMIEKICEKIDNVEEVKKSKQLPFRFLSASHELIKADAPQTMIVAVNNAMGYSCSNVPKLEGSNAVLVDVSGSMSSGVSANSSMSCMDIASVFGAALGRGMGADIYRFGDIGKRLKYNPGDTIQSIANQISAESDVGHGTSFSEAIRALSSKYDRLFFLTDCQGWYSSSAQSSVSASENDLEENALAAYKRTFKCDPMIYCIDLAGLGTSKFAPTRGKYLQIGGFSDRIFDLIKFNEDGHENIVKAIEGMKF